MTLPQPLAGYVGLLRTAISQMQHFNVEVEEKTARGALQDLREHIAVTGETELALDRVGAELARFAEYLREHSFLTREDAGAAAFKAGCFKALDALEAVLGRAKPS